MNPTRRIVLGSAALAALLIASGSLSPRLAAAQNTIKIGAPFNVTGALSSVDAPALNGAKLKVAEINAAGGVLGKKLELATYDTKTDPTVMASVASQLVNQDKVVAGVGFTDSDSVLALGPIFQQVSAFGVKIARNGNLRGIGQVFIRQNVEPLQLLRSGRRIQRKCLLGSAHDG